MKIDLIELVHLKIITISAFVDYLAIITVRNKYATVLLRFSGRKGVTHRTIKQQSTTGKKMIGKISGKLDRNGEDNNDCQFVSFKTSVSEEVLNDLLRFLVHFWVKTIVVMYSGTVFE